ncbi:hypothetical protein PHYSODRAFT_420054, partial [Phytophthora sojae]
ETEYPRLTRIATLIFTVPISFAAAERVSSFFSFVWLKRRNRLATDKVEKLVFFTLTF